jgi:hypothetical protein
MEGPARVVTQTRGAANKYAVHFTPSVAGVYKVTATVRGSFTQTYNMRVSDQTSPSQSRIEGPAKANAGSVYTCKTTAVDSQGAALPVDLGDKLNISVTAPEGSFSDIQSKANGDGTFTTTLNILKPGCDFSLDVKLNESSISNTPLKFRS